MNMHRTKTLVVALALSVGSAMAVHADPLSDVLAVGKKKSIAAQKSQQKIDKLADDTRDKLSDYKQTLKLIEDLRVYNRKLEIQIDNQNKRLGSIEKSISDVTVIQRQITPLLIRMIDGLEQFVELDVPFHSEERHQRIEFLRNNVDRPDLTVAEKFRQVLEAYKIENEYGRKIDTYRDNIPIDGVNREVNIFRVGRIAMLYQTTDGEITGAWDQKQRKWVELDPSEYRNAIRDGIRIAKKQASIDIITLPVAAPEAFKE